MSSTIIPTLRYRNTRQMTDWLCETFGFARHLVIEDGADGVTHAELTLGSGMVMLGQERDDAFGQLQVPPSADRPVTESPYLVVPDVDAVYDRARAAGAEIVMEIRDEDYGGRHFSCRDPEGQLWNFGSYDPWTKQP